jgi:DNA-binding NarL/FixJ family response regulator
MTDEGRIRVLSADDHVLLREGIATIIKHQEDMTLVSQACSGKEAIQQYREHLPDVTLMDLRMPPGLSGMDALLAILAEFPDARIIILTTFEGDEDVRRALDAGARAYLLKSHPPSQLLQVIRRVHAGEKLPLT